MISWTFGRKLNTALALLVLLVALKSAFACWMLADVAEAKDRVIASTEEALLGMRALEVTAERRAANARGFALTGVPSFRKEFEELLDDFPRELAAIRARDPGPRRLALLAEIEEVNHRHEEAASALVQLRLRDARSEDYARVFLDELDPRYDRLRELLAEYSRLEREMLRREQLDATAAARRAIALVAGGAGLVVAIALGIAWVLTRSLNRQIGQAAQHVQSSAAELQTAANQQASSSTEQVSAVQEIQATLQELLTSSKQIGESARHVAEVARDARAATETGEDTVRHGREAMAGVRRQVDLVVEQMLDLGRRSQEVGAVVELVSELSEQTNILAVNATIEARGAGAAGARFAAVADEIRTLAQRVGGSAREIRQLVEEVRAAVNASVMATESGAKSVTAAAGHLEGITANFERISQVVERNLEAAREIELSTNQQTTAVEQVHVAMAEVSQVARESDVSARQMLETATLLTRVSGELLRLVRPRQEA